MDNTVKNDTKHRIGAYLNGILSSKGWTQERLAKELGVSQGRLSEYLKGKNLPRADVLLKISKIGRTTVDALLKGGPKEAAGEEDIAAEAVTERWERFAKVNIYSLAGAGGPRELTEIGPIDTIILPKEFVRPSIVPIKIQGESMEPNIYDGAIVGVDKEDRQLISGKVYAVWLPYEGAVIKRLYIDAEKITLKSDNPLFPTYSIAIKEIPDNLILGRVKWVIQKL